MQGQLSVIQKAGVGKEGLWELLANNVLSVNVLHELTLFHV